LIAVPNLTRLLDTPGLLAAVCLDADGGVDRDKLSVAALTAHRTLAWQLGMPSLRILRRLTGGVLSEVRLQRLRELFADRQALQLLRHAPRICPAIVDSLSRADVRPHVANSFIGEISKSPLDAPRARDVIALGGFLHEFLPDTAIQSLRHYDRLWEEHGEQINAHASAVRRPSAFPQPPWDDEPGYAVAIRTPRALVAESVTMRNCSGVLPAFNREIRRGNSYFFHVEGHWGLPEATMLCVKDGDHWRIDDVRAQGNCMIEQRYVRILALWVAERQELLDAKLCMPRTKTTYHPFGVRCGKRVQ